MTSQAFHPDTHAQNHTLQHMTDASIVLHELRDILRTENDAILLQDVQPIEKNLRKKSRLSTKLDYLLKQIQADKDHLSSNAYAQQQAAAIQADIEDLQAISRQNMLHLKAAHEVRADTIRMIRQAFQAHSPQTETYNAAGTLQTGQASNKLVHKAI